MDYDFRFKLSSIFQGKLKKHSLEEEIRVEKEREREKIK